MFLSNWKSTGVPFDIERSLQIACRSEANTLITGPTGSGKTHLARLIHERGSRAGKPFVTVNLATLHEGTLESELFGHERGAFTGADLRRVGRLEAAQGGTVFLDEIGELSSRLQARLLDFLQSRVIVPVGGNRESRLDVRVLAATHRDLAKAVRAGAFREDLFHRLRVVSISMKPLCERSDQFDEIVHLTLEGLCRLAGRSVLRISEEVASQLEAYAWPGNLRELRNVLEYAVLASEGPEILVSHLPEWFVPGVDIDSVVEAGNRSVVDLGVAEAPITRQYQATVDAFEKRFLERALAAHGWKINHTARKIGLNKTSLIRRIRSHQIQIPVWE